MQTTCTIALLPELPQLFQMTAHSLASLCLMATTISALVAPVRLSIQEITADLTRLVVILILFTDASQENQQALPTAATVATQPPPDTTTIATKCISEPLFQLPAMLYIAFVRIAAFVFSDSNLC